MVWGNFMSDLHVNPDRSADFIAVLLDKLANERSRVAFWFYQPVDLPLTAEPIGTASPFTGSKSFLAGLGYLVHLTTANAHTLASFFTQDLDTLSALVHLVVESRGELQFRAYDDFSIIFLRPPWVLAYERLFNGGWPETIT